MTLSRGVSLVSAVLVGAGLSLAPMIGHAGPGPSESSKADPRVEGPARPPADPPVEQPAEQPGDAPAEQPHETPTVNPDAPTSELIPPPPTYDPGVSPESPGIEFLVPPPESEDVQRAPHHESALSATFPDPGVAPNDGNSMLAMSGTTLALTALAFTAGLTIGLQNQTPLEWLLPATIVPAAGLLAISGGGLYLGISRARAHHKWEVAYRVVGEPQGAGLQVGGTFMLLGALFFIPTGAFELQGGSVISGASMIAVGSAALVSTPIMFMVGARRKQNYARTGGWHRRPIPPIPERSEVGLRVTPLVAPTLGGVTVGASGQF